MTRSSRRSAVVTLAIVMSAGARAGAAQLKAETVAAWEQYVARVESRIARESRDGKRFLAEDFRGAEPDAALRARLGRGEIDVDNAAGGTVDVDGGTINHWRGSVLVPGVTLDDLLDGAALRGRAAQHRQEDVLESRVISRAPDALRLFLKLQRKVIVTVAYNSEHQVNFQRLGPARATSRSVSMRIAELRNPGMPEESEKPIGQDRGFLWRLHSYWRYEAVPGGVIVELESLTLSREIPWMLRAMAGPIIDHIARESMNRTLASLRARWART